MRVIACGDREWTDRAAVRRRLEALPPGTTVIHGAARGADFIADEEARRIGLPVVGFPAHWRHGPGCLPTCRRVVGRSAGPIRNREMLAYLKRFAEDEILVLAFHDDLSRSRGTADMVKIARKAGVGTEVIRSGGA